MIDEEKGKHGKKSIKNNSSKFRFNTWSEPIYYLLPFLIGIAIFTIFPIVNVFLISFREGYKLLTKEFTQYGLGNFQAVIQDRYFISSLKNTAIYVFTVVPISTAISIFFAVFLNKKLKLTSLYQTVFFLPMVTSIVAVGLAWKWMYNYDYGIFNYFLGMFGVEPINWLNDPKYGLLVLIIYGIWSYLPFTIILLLSGLQNVNPQYALAAKIDGANRFKIFTRITIPLLSPTIGLVLIINMISASKVFSELFPLFSGKPGAAYSLYTVVYYIYEMFYIKWRLGHAAAAAIILFFIVLIFTMLQLLIQKNWKHY
ncbi:MAG: carbohydrate ABC transporter permease [Candidatus Helarchaeota archaeon]